MGAPSLVSMAQRACARDIHAVQDIGDMQWELAEPIVRKVTNPHQLRKLEIASPHILDHTGPLWKTFITRDVPEWEDKIVEPKNPRSWWKVYRKLMRDEQQAKNASEQALMAALKGLDEKKEANKLNFVNKVIAEPTNYKPLFMDGVPNPYVNNSGKIRRPVLKNARTGREVMDALRKETILAKRQRNLTVNKAAQPLKAFVPSAKSQIAKAPQNMIREHQKPQLTAAAQRMAGEQGHRPTPKIFANSIAPSPADRAISQALREEQAKKEERLRALASGKSVTPLASRASQSTSTGATTQQSRPAPAAAAPPRAVVPVPSRRTLTAPSADSPPKAASPAPSTSEPPSRAVGEIGRLASPSPAPQVVRKRPAPSIFMPAKKRKV